MRIRYTATALAELDAIFAYIAERNPSAAATIVHRVEHTISQLVRFPKLAQETEDPGVRMIPVRRYPYLVFYTIDADEIVILYVRHAARRRPWEEGD